MKRAFLGTDEDLLAGTPLHPRSTVFANRTLKTQLTRVTPLVARPLLPY